MAPALFWSADVGVVNCHANFIDTHTRLIEHVIKLEEIEPCYFLLVQLCCITMMASSCSSTANAAINDNLTNPGVSHSHCVNLA